MVEPDMPQMTILV